MLDYISYYSLSFFRFSVLFYRNDLLVVTFSVPYFHMFFIHHWHFSKLLLCLYKIPSYSHGHTDAHSHLTSHSLWPIIYFYWHFLGWLFKIEDEEKKIDIDRCCWTAKGLALVSFLINSKWSRLNEKPIHGLLNKTKQENKKSPKRNMNVILNLSIVHSVLSEWIKRSAWNEPLNDIFNVCDVHFKLRQQLCALWTSIYNLESTYYYWNWCRKWLD